MGTSISIHANRTKDTRSGIVDKAKLADQLGVTVRSDGVYALILNQRSKDYETLPPTASLFQLPTAHHLTRNVRCHGKQCLFCVFMQISSFVGILAQCTSFFE